MTDGVRTPHTVLDQDQNVDGNPRPEEVVALVTRAHMHLANGEPREAIGYLETAVAMEPRNTRAHISLGVAYYETGDTDRAWDEFGWFYRPDSDLSSRTLDRPLWDGSELQGRTILLWTDQGLGDAILFLRYIPVVKSLGATVSVECHHPGLLPFVARMAAVDYAVIRGRPLPPFDVHAPLVYLPSLHRPARSSGVGEVPYLDVPDALTQTWRTRLCSLGQRSRKIGICWASGTSHINANSRSVPLRLFDKLADIPNLQFVSLQLGPQELELVDNSRVLPVAHYLNQYCSISDTAALMLSLDLVISVDTMIPHLAGALGRPVWTLLRYAPSWRYWGDNERTVWFPTMQLYRQTSPGDWNSVFDRVRDALVDLFV